MDRIIAAAIDDVQAMGLSTSTQDGKRELVKAITRHLEETKTTLDGAQADASTRAAAARATAGGYNAVATTSPAAMLPQAASMVGSAAPGIAGMTAAPTSMLSGMGGAMQMTPLANLAHAVNPQQQGTPIGDGANISDAVLSSDRTVAGGAVRRALAQIGKPYVWGGQGPSSFDCSGLVQYAYKGVGIDLPHHTYEQMRVGRQVEPNQAQAGDLVFSEFSGPGQPEHVQMALGNGQVVEAQQSGVPVKVSPMPHSNVVVKRIVA